MDEKILNLNIDKDNGDTLLEGEYSLLVEERTRRSNEQTEYLKFVLMGIVGQFAIFAFELLNSDTSFIDKIDAASLELIMLVISGAVVVLTTILFLFWLDHALTISAIDHYFKAKEKQNNIYGWYSYREEYSSNTFFHLFGIKINLMNLKIQFFKFSVMLSFLIPPILFVIIAALNSSFEEYQELVRFLNYVTFGIFISVLILGILVWTNSGKGIYFKAKKKN